MAIQLALSKTKNNCALLILDDETLEIVNSCLKMHELLAMGIVGVVNINKPRERVNITPIYLLTPSIATISRAIDDYKDRKQKWYGKKVHLFLSSSITKEGLNLITESRLRRYLTTFQEIFCDIISTEASVFTFPCREAFKNTYNSVNTNQELQYDSEKLFNVFNALRENPYIRYDKHSSKARRLAELCKNYNDEKRLEMSEFKARKNRATLLILDRAQDAAAPLLHELSYQCIMKDLIGGDTQSVSIPNPKYDENDEDSKQELTLDFLRDPLWKELRHENISQALTLTKLKFREFAEQQEVDDDSRQNLSYIVRQQPYKRKMSQSFTAHFAIIGMLTRLYKKLNLKFFGEFEQTIVTGLTDRSKKVGIRKIQENLSKILKDKEICNTLKLRLILIYQISQRTLSPKQLKSLSKAAKFSYTEIKVIENIQIVLDTIEEKSTLYYGDIQERARELNKSDFVQPRYEPLLSILLDKIHRGVLCGDEFPFFGDLADVAQSDETDDGNERAGIIVFVIGGLCWSESRVCYKKSEEFGRYILCGSSHIMSPNEYIYMLLGLTEDLDSMHSDDDEEQVQSYPKTEWKLDEGWNIISGEMCEHEDMTPELEMTESWRDLVEAACKDKLGWRMWNRKVLLCEASKKFGRCISLKEVDRIPFNETSAWWEQGGHDHWFEIEFNSPEILTDVRLIGKVFTSRIPRGLDYQTIDYIDSFQTGPTDRQVLIQKIKEKSIVTVFLLAEKDDFEIGKSESIVQFYANLGIRVVHSSLRNFDRLSLETEAENIRALKDSLAKGENCLLHCWDGDRRTGMVLMGLVLNIDVGNVIKYFRRTKSTYVHILDQEYLALRNLSAIREYLKNYQKSIASKVKWHLQFLCSHNTNKLINPHINFPDWEREILRKIFSIIDIHGDDDIVTIDDMYNFTVDKLSTQMASKSSVTKESLQSLFGHFSGNVRKLTTDIESVTFEMFLKVMKMRVILDDSENTRRQIVGKEDNSASPDDHSQNSITHSQDGAIVEFNDLMVSMEDLDNANNE